MADCFVYVDDEQGIDVDSVAETPESVRDKYLRESMGWRYDYPERCDQDEAWGEVLRYGKVVTAIVETVPKAGEEA